MGEVIDIYVGSRKVNEHPFYTESTAVQWLQWVLPDLAQSGGYEFHHRMRRVLDDYTERVFDFNLTDYGSELA